jgi:hypothetical protein
MKIQVHLGLLVGVLGVTGTAAAEAAPTPPPSSAPAPGKAPPKDIWAEPEPEPSSVPEPHTTQNGYVTDTATPRAPIENERLAPEHHGKRGSYVHDGFYLRFALGPGYLSSKTQNRSTIKGWGVGADLWLGGSPLPGLALGVTFNGVTAPNPRAELTAADTGGLGAVSGNPDGYLGYSVVGLFGDYYPDPTGGLHFMAGISYSTLKFTANSGGESNPASGLGLVGGVGYEWWVGREWSVGPVARLHWASLNDDVEGWQVLSPVLLLGFTYH